MNVVVLKMSNGDELIARALPAPSSHFSHVMKLVVHQAPDGRVGMSMMPYIATAKYDSVCINKDHIVATGEVEAGVEKKYIEQTSGIALM